MRHACFRCVSTALCPHNASPAPPRSGCFVAGKDAGRAYNTWPDMNGEWFPSEYFSERLPGEPQSLHAEAAGQRGVGAMLLACAARHLHCWRSTGA